MSFLLSLCLLAPVQAPQELQVSGIGGWGGRVLRGEPAPVQIDLDNPATEDRPIRLRVTWAAPGASQNSARPPWEQLHGRIGAVHESVLILPARSRKRLSLALPAPEGERHSLWVYALNANGRTLGLGELPVRTVEAGKRLVAVVGRAPLGGFEKAGCEFSRILPDELPEESAAYFSLHALLWLDGRAGELRSPAQVDALSEWIQAGGHFIVSRSSAADFGGSAVAGLLPVKLGTGREFLLLDGLRPVAPPPDGRVVVLESTRQRGRVLLEQEEVPLVVDERRAGGRVTFIAFDLSKDPFPAWKESSAFWIWLLGTPAPVPARPELLMRAPGLIGNVALARHAAEFPNVEPPQIGGLFLLIILYVIVVGPFDYLLLRMLKRLEWTWFSFPGYVALFTVVILVSGGAFIQRAAHQREISVIDHFPESGSSRVRSVAGLLAPADGEYGISGGADPVSTNFIARALYNDVMGELVDTTVVHGEGPRETHSWRLNRLSTGLAVLDRPGSGPAPVQYRIESRSEKEITLRITVSGGEYESSFLATSEGFYWMGPLAPGERSLTGARHYSNLDAFLEAHGQIFTLNQAGDNQNWAMKVGPEGTILEENVRPLVRRCLMGLSFPPRREDLEALSGIARRLDARPWIDAGGSVLLAWPKQAGPIIRFGPAPAQVSTVVLHRIFQGPPP